MAIQGDALLGGMGAPSNSTTYSPTYDANNNITGYNNSPTPNAAPTKPLPLPANQPAVLTSANIDDKNSANSAALANRPKAGQSAGADGFVRNADQSFAEAPSTATATIDGNGNQTWSSGGLTYAIGPSNGKISEDPATQSLYDQFTTLKSQMDATGAANIESIKQQYQQLRQEQTQANAGAEAGTYSLLARGGSLQTDSSGGLMHSLISSGLSKIADLNNKEQQAIIAAQTAQQTGDMKVLDEQLSIAQKANTDRQAAAAKLNNSIQTATAQVRKENAINGVLQTGETDPAKILSTLKSQGYDTISAKDIADTIANLSPDAKDIHQMLTDAAKNGAPQSVLAAIGSSKTLADAVAAAGQYTTDPTSTAGQYKAAVAAGYKGTPGDFIAAQKYKEAYATESAKNAFTDSDKNQQKLEQQGRQVILKEMSNRSGGLGLQDAKVNQAIHLRALLEQYKTTAQVHDIGSAGNTLPGTTTKTVYNVPPAQYAELAIGLANLVSPTGTTAESDRQAILSHTAKGDLNGAIQYITGSPQTGNTQDIIRNMSDSIERQGAVAEQERQTYINNLQGLLPTDLTADRRDALINASGLNSFVNPEKNTPANMSPAQIDEDAFGKIQSWSASDPKNAALLNDLSQQFPNLSNVELAQKLKLIP